jgi:hypothetical protein
MQEEERTQQLKVAQSVLVEVRRGQAREGTIRFSHTFQIGRHKDNDLQLTDACVSRNHVKIGFDGQGWWIRDMESTNGTYLNGVRIQEVRLPGEAEVELGKGGPLLWLVLEKEETRQVGKEVPGKAEGFASATQIIQRFFAKSKSEKVGEQTMMFRRALERVYKKRSRKYLAVIGMTLIFLLAAGVMIFHQKNRLLKLSSTATDIFYSMKSLELQIAQIEEVVLLKANKDQVREILTKRKQLQEMEKNYDHFVKELGVYKKMREEERTILQMARLFGECEVNVPDGFVKEVWNYIEKWKSTGQLKEGIDRAKLNNFIPAIIQVLVENNLTPHFFYLALKESGFESRAVGPKTKHGYAKGVWQLIPTTAQHYGLKIGPLYKMAVYDSQDERFSFEKATKAAVRYIKDLNNTEAQASGLLVMASYNWGETKIREIIRQTPENPRKRNFWRLLADTNIPQQTYDYVLYTFSAAVICENPRLFGFDFDCPFS